jgi:hypothetical protein
MGVCVCDGDCGAVSVGRGGKVADGSNDWDATNAAVGQKLGPTHNAVGGSKICQEAVISPIRRFDDEITCVGGVSSSKTQSIKMKTR